MEAYFDKLLEGKLDEAEQIRLNYIPSKLYKFVRLDGSNYDDDKYFTLKSNCVWVSRIDKVNDPYEFCGMILDRNAFYQCGITDDVIDIYEHIFDADDYGMVSFSSAGYENLPMWAYYTNNSQGFCVEYDVIKKDAIHEVIYEREKVRVSKIVLEAAKYTRAVLKGNNDAKNFADAYNRLLMHSMYIKDISWKHEKEYRIIIPDIQESGKNIPISLVGLRLNRIIAGINCSKTAIEILDEISKNMGYGHIYCARKSKEFFGIDLIEYKPGYGEG